MNKKNKAGLSGIIEMLIMIGLVLAATVVIWGVVSNILNENIKSTESCFGDYSKVTLEKKYTCFDDATDKVRVSLNVGDVEVEEVLISISNDAGSESFKLSNEEQTSSGLTYFGGTSPVKLPGKNGGKTYLYDWNQGKPGTIKIAPIIDGTQCEISDTMNEIDDCSTLSG